MLSFSTLTEEFVIALEAAILEYQTSVGEDKLSTRRAADIAALTDALEDNKANVFTLRISVKQILEGLTTGWFIFKTGNSRLKANINAILENVRFQNEAFLQQQILDLQQQVMTLQHNPVNDTRVQQLELALDEAHDTIDAQAAELAVLKAQNRALRMKVFRFQSVLGYESDAVELSESRPSSSKAITIRGQRSSFFPEGALGASLDAEVDSPRDDEHVDGYVSPGTSFGMSLSLPSKDPVG